MRFFSQKSSPRAATANREYATRVVKGSNWIHRNQLEIGMYVSELDRPWSETSFMFQGFEIDSLETLVAVQDAAEYVLVDSEKLARVAHGSPHRFVSKPVQTH